MTFAMPSLIKHWISADWCDLYSQVQTLYQGYGRVRINWYNYNVTTQWAFHRARHASSCQPTQHARPYQDWRSIKTDKSQTDICTHVWTLSAVKSYKTWTMACFSLPRFLHLVKGLTCEHWLHWKWIAVQFFLAIFEFNFKTVIKYFSLLVSGWQPGLGIKKTLGLTLVHFCNT